MYISRNRNEETIHSTIMFIYSLLEALIVKISLQKNIYLLVSGLIFSGNRGKSGREKEYLERRELSRRSSLFEKLRWRVEKISPATHVMLIRHYSALITDWINEGGKGLSPICSKWFSFVICFVCKRDAPNYPNYNNLNIFYLDIIVQKNWSDYSAPISLTIFLVGPFFFKRTK